MLRISRKAIIPQKRPKKKGDRPYVRMEEWLAVAGAALFNFIHFFYVEFRRKVLSSPKTGIVWYSQQGKSGEISSLVDFPEKPSGDGNKEEPGNGK